MAWTKNRENNPMQSRVDLRLAAPSLMLLAMTAGSDMEICSRDAVRPRFAREVSRPSKSKGAGNAGCTLHPRSRVQMGKESAHEHTGSAEAIRHSLRNGFTAYFVISPENRACLPPSPADSWLIRARSGDLPSADLTPTSEAPGPHDFAVRFGTARQRALGSLTGRKARPAIPSRARRRRVHRIPPRVSDDPDTPLCGTGRGELYW